MNVIDAIFSRRSIRKFKDITIAEKDIKIILSAGMSAPSGYNAQTWRFVILDHSKEGVSKKIAAINPYASMAQTAPMSILVCGTKAENVPIDFWVVDCSACIQNMLLAAYSLGIGSLWTGIYPIEDRMKAFSEFCKLPQNIFAHSLIILGYADEAKPRKEIYNENFVHYDFWENK
ncbi:MAG: nitroreductase family protein [Elusimicrobiota bacterium]|jgi:nitroreductase|nr:nitroreductase family protein [Elusimicrobiota bacterium]